MLISTMMASSNVANEKQNLHGYDLPGIYGIVPDKSSDASRKVNDSIWENLYKNQFSSTVVANQGNKGQMSKEMSKDAYIPPLNHMYGDFIADTMSIMEILELNRI
ncbi:hypothetical protein V6N12_051319 [Hibiscus sabdariffa]|uniref:Uncharacterized protein n=1 Tax=Hibiscus sabdariffa TaxID=183260 RepID=A0ABR2GG17_9ROSI